MTEVKRRLRSVLRTIRRTLKSRSLWACLLSLSLAGTIFFISGQIKTVYIRDGDQIILRNTLKREPGDILDESGIVTMAFDVVDFSGFEGKMGVISISRAFPVTLTVDGATKSVMVTDMRVGEMLEQQGISLGEFDEINIPQVLFLSPSDHIVIKRINVRTTVETETIPYSTQYKQHSLIKAGQTRVLSAGSDGERVLTYAERIVDGVLQERELIKDVVVKEPVTQLVLKGTSDPVSDLDFGISLDANGVPVSYQKLLTNQICTGYSARPGAKGAGRMQLYDGYVAVRANEIPYGTKMYITSADGSFVYGFAIAADTGIGLMANTIDFDLFYETYNESRLNGRKYLNVYIL